MSVASSLSEILLCLPISYRNVLSKPLQDLAALVHKAGGVGATLRKLQAHKASGSYPQQMQGCHEPSFALTKEFQDTNPAMKTAMSEAYSQFMVSYLDSAISLKSAEVEWIEARLAMPNCLPPLFELCQQAYSDLAEMYKEPIWDRHGPGSVDVTLAGWQESPVYKDEYTRFCADLPTIVARVLTLERAKVSSQEHKLKAKVQLKEQADVEMGDASTSSQSLQATIAQEVAKALSKEKSKEKSKASTLHSSHAYYSSPDIDFLGPSTQEKALVKGTFSQVQPWWQEWQEDYSPFAFPHSQVQGISAKEACHRVKQVRQEVVLAEWRYDIPSSYPDAILRLPTPLAISVLITRVPLAKLEAARFRSHVHLGEGVVMPDSLAIHISAGMRFMFHKTANPNLITDAYDKFCNTLRWKIFFSTNDVSDEPYDPDYASVDPSKNTVLPKKAELYIEQGLDKGREYIDRYLSSAPYSKLSTTRDSGMVKVTELEEYCLKNNLIISPTDKNLGTAVVSRDWFIRSCEALLEDKLNYRVIDADEKKALLHKTLHNVLSLSTLPGMEENKQLSGYLRSKVPLADESPKLPVFYGIPKIHKKPIKMRPIVPCHSNMQAPAAKYVSKQLKPLVNSRPYILRGSKDLAQKLSKVVIPYGKKAYLISGDIVAFYPNIPKSKALKIVMQWWLKEYGVHLTALDRNIFLRAVQVAMNNLIFEFQDKTYLQLRGVAMGIACSPDIAQLYGAHFEEKFFESPHPEYLFYGRYIDDCLGIVVADSHDEAMKLALCIGDAYEDVELTWSVSEWNTPFLDMLVYLDPVTHTVEHTPFRKAQNHKERIPWASHHPKDVKKGTFLGEMSRLATLSSRRQHYLEAIRELGALYIARGYPVDLVHHWIKTNLARRWMNRLHEPSESTKSVLVLKSSFNPVWETFNIHELWNTIKEEWLARCNAMAWCDLPSCEAPGHGFGKFPRPIPDSQKTVLHTAWQIGGDKLWEVPVRKPKPLERDAARGDTQNSLRGLTMLHDEPPITCTNELGKHIERLPQSETPMSHIRVWNQGSAIGYVHTELFDIRRSDLLDHNFLVSRKRNTNLSDLTAQWKRVVLEAFVQEEAPPEAHMDAWEV